MCPARLPGPLVTLAVALGLAACGDLLGPDTPDVRISSTASTITLEPDGGTTVTFAITNRGVRPIHLARCGETVVGILDRREAAQWTPLTGAVCLGIYSSVPLLLRPGEGVELSHPVWTPGTYRLRIGVYRDRHGPGDWTVTSNPFAVVE